MTKMVEYYKLSWRRWSDFSGRSSREEYWWTVLMNVLIVVAVHVVNSLLFLMSIQSASYSNFEGAEAGLSASIGFSFLSIIFYIIICIPSIALIVRRYRDIGLVDPYPYIALAVSVILMFFPGSFVTVLINIGLFILLASPTDKFNAGTTAKMEQQLRKLKDRANDIIQSATQVNQTTKTVENERTQDVSNYMPEDEKNSHKE